MKKYVKALIGAGCALTAGFGLYKILGKHYEKKLEKILEEYTEDDIPDFYEDEGYDFEDESIYGFEDDEADEDPVWAKLTLMDAAAINDCLNRIRDYPEMDREEEIMTIRKIIAERHCGDCDNDCDSSNEEEEKA